MASVDDRIVNMQFNNREFEKGIKTTLDSLSDLDKGLKFDGIKSKISELSSMANGIKLDGLANAVENVGSKFEGLRAIATGALLSIGTHVVDLGKNVLNNMTRAARDGFGEYETQINAIQTIMANTSAKGTTMGQINDALAELNSYADMTIYNFSEMTRNIGTFTAAGVDLETSVSAIKGIANLAAVSGSSSQQAATAMYQLSQALSSGTVKLMDWNSVVNAGMGGEVFQNALKETARAHGIAVDDMISKSGSFRESLSEGWLTSGVLLETLSKFTGDLSKEQLLSMGYTEAQADEIVKLGQVANDAATKVKTFSQLLGTLAEATGSGWAQTWQIIIGDFEEAKAFFTEVSDALGAIIGESADARNEQLKIWKDGGGREAVIQGLRNAFEAVMKVVGAIKEAFQEVFPPRLGQTLLTLSFWFRDFTAGLIMSDDAAANLKMVFKALFIVLKFGFDIIAGVVRVVWSLLGIIFTLIGAVGKLLNPIFTFVRSFIPVQEGAEGAAWSIGSLFDILVQFLNFINGGLIKGIDNLASGFDKWLKSDGPRKSLVNLWNALVAFGQAVAAVYNILFRDDFTSNPLFQEDSPFVDFLFKVRDAAITAGKAIGNFFKGLGDAFSNIRNFIKDGFSNGFSNINWDVVLAGLNAGLLATIMVAILKVANAFKGLFGDTKGLMKNFAGILDELGGVLKAFQSQLKAKALKDIAIAIGILALALLVLSTIDPNRLISAIAGMSTAFAMLVGGFAIMTKLLDTTLTLKDYGKIILMAVGLQILGNAILLLAAAVKIMGSMSWEDLAKGVGGIAVLIGGLLLATKVLANSQKDVIIGAAALGILAAALNMLIIPVIALGLLPMANLIQGLIGVTIAIAVLAGVALLLGTMWKNAAVGTLALLSLAAALNMLVIPITTLGLLPIDNLVQGMVAVGIALGVLVGLALLLGTMWKSAAVGTLALLSLAAALNMLITPILALAFVPWANIWNGLSAVMIALGALVLAALALSWIGPLVAVGAAAIILLGAAMMALVFPLLLLAAVPGDVLAESLTKFGMVLNSIVAIALQAAPALALLGILIIPFAAGLLAIALAVAVFAATAVILIPVMIAFAGALALVAAMMPKISEAIPAFLGVGAALIVFGLGAAIAGAGIIILGASLVVLGAGLMLLGLFGAVGASGLTAFVNATAALLPQALPLLAMAGVLLVLGAAVLLLGAGITVLGVGLLLVGAALAIFAGIGIMGAAAMSSVLNTLLNFVGSVPGILVLAAALGLLGIAIIAVGAGLLVLGIGALLAAGGLAVLGAAGPLVVAAFTAIATGLAMIAPHLLTMAAFTAILIAFGVALIAFGAGALVASVGVLLLGVAFLLLATGLDLLSKSLARFAVVGTKGTAALLAFYASLDGMIWQVPALLSIGAAFLVLGAGLMVLGAGLLIVGVGAVGAAAGLMLLGVLGPLVETSLMRIMAAVLAFVPVGITMGLITGVNLLLAASFAALALAALAAGAGLALTQNSLKGLLSTGTALTMVLSLMMRSVGTTMPQFQNDLNTALAALKVFAIGVELTLDQTKSGLERSKLKLELAAKLMLVGLLLTLSVGLAGMNAPLYSNGFQIGDNIVRGIRDGIQNGSSSLNTTAKRVALNALDATKKALGINSPSKEGIEIGEFYDMGIALGMVANAHLAEKAATAVGERSIEALKNTFSNISADVLDNMDVQPTITPVLDLSAIRKDAALIGGVLNGDSLDVRSTYQQASALSSEEEARRRDLDSDDGSGGGDTINYTQNNYSPKALSDAEIYRKTNNQISKKKEELAKR